MRGAPRRFLKENMANVVCYSLTAFGVCLFMDEVDELGDGLETYVEFSLLRRVMCDFLEN